MFETSRFEQFYVFGEFEIFELSEDDAILAILGQIDSDPGSEAVLPRIAKMASSSEESIFWKSRKSEIGPKFWRLYKKNMFLMKINHVEKSSGQNNLRSGEIDRDPARKTLQIPAKSGELAFLVVEHRNILQNLRLVLVDQMVKPKEVLISQDGHSD